MQTALFKWSAIFCLCVAGLAFTSAARAAEPVVPEGWHNVSDANKMVSFALPPEYVTDDAAVAAHKKLYDGFDTVSKDAKAEAEVAIIRFEGVKDDAAVAKSLVAAYKKDGIELDLGEVIHSKRPGNDVEIVFYSADAKNAAGEKFRVSVNLIPTPKGIVVVTFSCPEKKFSAWSQTMWKIVGTMKIAK